MSISATQNPGIVLYWRQQVCMYLAGAAEI